MVLCDTSGRLHTNLRLMEELAKCRRSLEKCLPGAPHETLLVLDGTTGPLSASEAAAATHTRADFLPAPVVSVMQLLEVRKSRIRHCVARPR